MCRYVFDLVDKKRCGVVLASALTNFLSSPELNGVVATSCTLSKIVNGDAKLLQCLSEGFDDEAMSAPPKSGAAGSVSRECFLEFCSLVEDMTDAINADIGPSDGGDVVAPAAVSEDDANLFVTSQY